MQGNARQGTVRHGEASHVKFTLEEIDSWRRIQSLLSRHNESIFSLFDTLCMLTCATINLKQIT